MPVADRLLVGAPLDKNLQPNTTKSGALWKCSLSTALRDCQQVITDGKRTVDSNHLMAPQKDEIKEDQWLGVSVRSQGPGKRAVVCAHRYIWKQGETQNGQGLCYTLSNELDMQDLWMPCKGQRITREHEEFGFCQAGISSLLLEDNTLLLGSPGSYTWRGTMFALDTVEDILTRDHTFYLAPVEDGASPVEKYSYLGMSVVGARFFSSNFSYAAGAPRARGTGQVVMFQKRQSDWASTDIYLLNFTLIFNGEQFGSSFGYEVASADVNGDGLPDLLIGAPFYFSRDVGGAVYLYLNKNHNLKTKHNLRLTGKPESQFGISIANAGDLNKDGCEDIAIGSPYEGNGVVYIHFGDRKKGLHIKPDQVITAESLPNVQPVVMKTFGYSLSGGLDLDANGYPDLLIGAYESSSVVLIRTRPIIDIITSIEPSNTIINIDPTKHGCERNRSAEYTCFSFKACCNIKSSIKSTNSLSMVHYEIEAETFPGGRKYSRVFFDDDKTEIAKTINVKTNVMNCEEHIVYLRNNTRDIQTPIKFQLTYTLVHAKPQYYSSGPLPNIDDYPVLNATARTTFSANFLNDCGDDGVCISDLTLNAVLDLPKTNSGYALTLGKQDEIRLEVSATNLGESAYEAQLFVQHHSSLHYVAAEIKDKHVICTSVNKTVVSCLLENPFTRQPNGSEPIILRFDPRGLDDNEPSVTFTVWANSTSKELHPGKIPLQLEATVIKNADLLIKGAARPEQVFYGGDVKGESAMKYFDDVGTRVVHTYQVINKGHWRVHSARVVISWPYQVGSDNAQGKWLLYPEDLPTVDEESDQSNGECFLISGSEINPLKLTPRPGVTEPLPAANLEMEPFLPVGKLSVSSNEKEYNETKGMEYSSAFENKVRRKRDNDVIKAEAYTDKDGQRKHVVNMSCQNKTAKCIQFQCLIYRLGRMQTTTISVRARLWNSTLVEDYPRVSHVNIASTAYIHIPEHYNTTGVVDATKVETVAYPDLKFVEATEVPYWVIIVSVIVGLIVLILLIIALWKLGFFKRSRPDPTLSGNLEKNNHESSPFIGRDRSIR